MRRHLLQHHHQVGFVLIELLVTLVIIGLLIAATAVSLRNAQVNSRDSKRIGDGLTIEKGIDAYATTQRGHYPGSTDTLCAGSLSNEIAGYLSGGVVPSDPQPEIPGGGATNYRYCYTYYRNDASSSNLADAAKTRYLIEVGLEHALQADITTYHSAGDYGVTFIPVSSSLRTPVYVSGPFCGTSCP